MVQSDRVLFARIGRMRFYTGPRADDQKPVGAGRHNKTNLGYEAFNFLPYDGKLFGFLQRKPNLGKIESSTNRSESLLGNVTVIFVAPYDGGQRIVGWYRNATVYREGRERPRELIRRIEGQLPRSDVKSFSLYRVECDVRDGVLLPTHVRTRLDPIPRGKGGFGQWNLCYLHPQSKTGRRADWQFQVLELVDNYKGANLLTNPAAEVDEERLQIALEQSAGFQSDVKIRREIEEYSMRVARQELERREFVSFKRTAELQCFDYQCEKPRIAVLR